MISSKANSVLSGLEISPYISFYHLRKKSKTSKILILEIWAFSVASDNLWYIYIRRYAYARTIEIYSLILTL